MKTIFLLSVLFFPFLLYAQDCTDESALKEPGRYLDAHSGKPPGGAKQGFSAASIANAKKVMIAYDNICRKSLQFTGGQAKASFGLNSKPFYNRQEAIGYTYNLGFHAFVCNVQTHKLAIVSEYLGVLRVTSNPYFHTAFSSSFSVLASVPQYKPEDINVFNYYAWGDDKIAGAINTSGSFFELADEIAGNQRMQLLQKPGAGYGWYSTNGFIKIENSLIFRHAYITHTDIPFFIPVSRKKFLTDLLEYYKLEKPVLIASMQEKIKKIKATIAESEKTNSRYLQGQKNQLAGWEQDAQQIAAANEGKQQAVAKLLQAKEEWLSQQAVVARDNQSFIVPNVTKLNVKDVYGEFYFTEFYTGAEGMYLYQINPDYLKKYPPTGARPSLIKIMYRFKARDRFLAGVNEEYINKLDLEAFRKLL